MKRNGKRILSLLTACVLTAGLLALPAGASGSSAASTDRADRLASLDLFRGTSSGYELDRTPTRIEGLVMLIRLLGLEEDALACTAGTPFTDLGWGGEYVAYAYTNGLTTGTSATTFSPDQELTAPSYVTFLLRALGYDVAWGEELDAAAGISMVSADAAAQLRSIRMDRGDMADLSYAALTCKLSGSEQTLAEKLCADGVFSAAAGETAGVLGSGAGWVYTYEPSSAPAPEPAPAPSSSAVQFETRSVSTSAGAVNVNMLTVDTKDPKVTVRSAMVNNTLGATAPFSQIVQSSGALAVINGNFFESYQSFQTPIGHVMVDGQFLYTSTGLTCLGITESGELRVGRPAVFGRITPADHSTFWAAYEINSTVQFGSVLYTPAYGSAVAITSPGHVMTVSGGSIASYQPAAAGTSVAIPSDGYVLYMDGEFTSSDYFRAPVVGTAVALDSYLFTEDPEGFTLDGVVSIISGAPRLVQDGAAVTTLENGFNEARFTTASSPRTAAGVNAEGRLVLVSVPAATVQQMREIMLALGCVDAFNLDGGASCAMYYDGAYVATPGRELTVTLQIFVDP